MTHAEKRDCPCKPERRRALGGGEVMVHRRGDEDEGRATPSNRAMDRYCPLCGAWHIVGSEHREWLAEIRGRFAAYLASLGGPLNDESRRAVVWLTR